MTNAVDVLRITTLLLVMATASGCQWYKTVTFTPAELSGKTDGVKFELVYYKDGMPQTAATSSTVSLATSIDSKVVIKPEIKNSFTKRLSESCKVTVDKRPEIPAAAIPLIAAAGKLAFDAGADYLAERVRAIQEKAKATYAARLVMDTKPFDFVVENQGKRQEVKECLIAYRYRAIGKEPTVQNVPGMIMIFELQKLTNTFYLAPIFLWVGDSVAETSSKDPTLDLSVAVAARVAESSQGKISMKSVVESTFKFSINSLGSGPTIDCAILTCKMFSELTTSAAGNATGATISVAVVETGSHASMLDKAQAELQAFKTAVGPAAKDALAKELTP